MPSGLLEHDMAAAPCTVASAPVAGPDRTASASALGDGTNARRSRPISVRQYSNGVALAQRTQPHLPIVSRTKRGAYRDKTRLFREHHCSPDSIEED